MSDPASGEAVSQPPSSSERLVRILASYGLAAACLYWVFHDVRFKEVLAIMGGVHWWGPVAAVVLNFIVYLCVAWQWQVLLKPSTPLSFVRAVQTVFAGRFANDVLPVHAGYLVRIFLVSRWTGVPAGIPAASLVVERLMEGLWLALGLGIVAMYLPLPAYITRSVTVLGATIIGGAAAFVFLALRQPGMAPRQPPQWVSRWKLLTRAWCFGHQLTAGIRNVSSWKVLIAALGISVVKLLVQALAFLSLLWAYGFQLSAAAQATIFLIAFAGISIPSTPAGVGVFQFACVLGLQLYEVPKTEATSFALLAFVLLTVPLAVAGFFAFGRSGLSLGRLRRGELGTGQFRRSR